MSRLKAGVASTRWMKALTATIDPSMATMEPSMATIDASMRPNTRPLTCSTGDVSPIEDRSIVNRFPFLLFAFCFLLFETSRFRIVTRANSGSVLQSQRALLDHDQRLCKVRRRRTGHAAPLDPPRRPRHDRHEVRLRRRRLRRVHSAAERRSRPLVPDRGERRQRKAVHDDRRTLARCVASVSARLDRGRRRAVRLLPGRDDHDGVRAPARQAESEWRRHRRGDERSRLPLRNVSAHSQGDSSRGETGSAEMRRREFLKLSAAGGAALVIGFHIDAEPSSFQPNGWVRIEPSGKIVLTVGKQEMGQGVRTSLPMILADELDADWQSIELLQAEPSPQFQRLGTGGSGSVYGSWKPLRTAGAAARTMLIGAAAAKWNVDAASLRTEKGFVINTKTNERLSYGALASDAAKQPVPAEPKLKAMSELRIVGQRVKKVDAPDVVSGKAIYGIDARMQ